MHAAASRNGFTHRPSTSRARMSRRRRLSFQAMFAKDPVPAVAVDHAGGRNFRTLPRSFAAYAHEYAHASKYYDDDAFQQPPELPVTPPAADEPFLLDDDPFADLSGGPKLDTPPLSPLAPPEVNQPPPAIVPRTTSAQTTPAYQKPAFRTRPSLPSLSTLAKMNLVVPQKVRRGHVGAGLPHEPWDDPLPLSPTTPSAATPIPIPTSAAEPLSPMSTPTPVSPLTTPSTPSRGETFLDLFDHSDDEEEPLSSPKSLKTASWSPTHKAAPSLALVPLEAAGFFHLHPEAVLVTSPRALSPPLPLPPPPVPTKSPVLQPEAPPLPLKDLDAIDLSPRAVPTKAHDEQEDQDPDYSGVAYAALAAGGLGFVDTYVEEKEQSGGAALTRSTSIELARTASHSSASSEHGESEDVSELSYASNASPALSYTHSSSEVEAEYFSRTLESGSSYLSPMLSREASASSLASSSSGSEGPESEKRIRRRFRKSSLFGDLLRFAPASPGAPGGIWGGDMRLETSDGELEVAVGLGGGVENMELEMEMGGDGNAYDGIVYGDADADGEEEGEDEFEVGEEEGDPDTLTPADLDTALNRLSTANDTGHESIHAAEGVAFPVYDEYPSYSSPPYSSPRLARSPSSVRSPASSSGAEEHELSWDFGWLRESASATSVSASSDFDENENDHADVSGGPSSPRVERKPSTAAPPPTPVASSSMYSDDELNRSFLFPPRQRRLIDEEGEEVEPGTSAGTIKASARAPASRVSLRVVGDQRFWGAEGEGQLVDGSGWEGAGAGSNSGGEFGGGSGSGSGYGSGSGRARSTGRGKSGGVGGGWVGRGDDDEEDENRRPRGSSFSTPSSSESEDDESSEDDYGEPVPPPANTAEGAGVDAANSDDDVPLAQRIPSALTAQRTIRKKVREEREERRREREARRARQATLRPARPKDGGQSPLEVASSSREAARLAEAAVHQRTRTRTQTLPGNGSGSAAVDDLTRKLQTMQSTQAERQRSLTINNGAASGAGRERSLPPLSPRMASASPPAQHPPLPEGARGLRPQRSFHRPSTAGGASTSAQPEPFSADADARVKRSATTRRPVDDSRVHRSNTRGRADTGPAFLSEVPPSPVPAPAPPPNKLTKTPPTEKRSPRPSVEMTRPSLEVTQHHHAASKSQGTLTRVFVGDMQRFNMVEIGPTTTAKQALAVVEGQGSLKGWVGTGGWMVWEVAQDFGMERPIRSFEQLADVQASWNKDKMVNMFVIKLTPLAPILSRSNIPASSPLFSGYVEWEIKRGKWVKRYLRLREHSLFLCKRDNGKDEVFLCSLSNFDAYNVTRLTKAPKPFVFAVKSTDNLSFFENTADYLHVFACHPRDGDKWVEKILLARSYVLHQERNILFNKPAGGNTTGLSRAGTRIANAAPQRAAPPLVKGSPLLAAPDRNDVFAPGSLLRDS